MAGEITGQNPYVFSSSFLSFVVKVLPIWMFNTEVNRTVHYFAYILWISFMLYHHFPHLVELQNATSRWKLGGVILIADADIN